jgi:hypothetical protein
VKSNPRSWDTSMLTSGTHRKNPQEHIGLTRLGSVRVGDARRNDGLVSMLLITTRSRAFSEGAKNPFRRVCTKSSHQIDALLSRCYRIRKL